MRRSFQHRLVNPPFGDPALYLSLAFHHQALLFDAGDIGTLSSREILKIDTVFISHTHMDHFCGFDRILRLCLGRDKEIRLFGPADFLSHLEAKLKAYQWNLTHNDKYRFAITATEVTDHQMITRTYRCREGFAGHGDNSQIPFTGTLLETPRFTVQAAILDHKIPCLGFALRERFHINIVLPALADLGLTPGPWLTSFKNHIFAGHPPETIITVPASHTADAISRPFSLGRLTRRIVRKTTGQKVAYVTDAGFTPANIARITALAEKADHLFIEAAFLEKDAPIAARKYHLTARQAGHLAAAAGVKDFTVFHFSPRYTDRPGEIEAQARQAFNSRPQNNT